MSQDLVRLSAAVWRTSSFTAEGENCVVVGRLSDIAGVRDSKLGNASPILVFAAGAFDAMLTRLTS